MRPVVAIVATVDTKAAETAFLRDELEARGCEARVVDVGLHAGAADREQDVSARVVAAAGGGDVEDLRVNARRDHAMATMAAGAAAILAGWHQAGRLDAVLGIGGNQGTAIAAAAMRELPFGMPKYIVSTVASGNVRGYVGDSDIVFAFSVGDLLGGPNVVTETILRQAAAAVAAMATVRPPSAERCPAAGRHHRLRQHPEGRGCRHRPVRGGRRRRRAVPRIRRLQARRWNGSSPPGCSTACST